MTERRTLLESIREQRLRNLPPNVTTTPAPGQAAPVIPESVPVGLEEKKGPGGLKGALSKLTSGAMFTGDLVSVLLARPAAATGIFGEQKKQEMEKLVSDAWATDGGFFKKLSALRGVQRERSSLFWGEKFVTSIVGDPLTYTGLGLLGKIPLAGRVLGPMDAAYTRFVQKAADVPFKAIGKGASFLPQPTVFKTSRVYNDSYNAFRNGFSKFTGKGITTTGDSNETVRFLNEHVLAMTPETAMANPDAKVVLELLRTNRLTDKEIEVIKGFAPNVSRDKLAVIDDLLGNAASGRLPEGEAFDRILTALEKSPMDSLDRKQLSLMFNKKVQAQNQIVEKLARLSPEDATKAFASHAANQAGLEIRTGIAVARENSALVGAILNAVDPAYTTIWRNGIERYFAAPLAHAVLQFPNFGPMNVLENVGFIISGHGNPLGRMTITEFDQATLGHTVPASLLRRTAREADPVFGVLGPVKKGELHLPFLGDESFIGRFNQKFSDLSVGMKRNFYAQKLAYHQELLEKQLIRDVPQYAKVVERVVDVPKAVPDQYRQEIERRMRIALSTNDPKAVRGVGTQFTEKRITEKEIHQAVQKYDELDVYSRQRYKQVKSKADIETIRPEVEQQFREGLLRTPEYADARLSSFRAAITANPAKNPAEFTGMVNMLMEVQKEMVALRTAMLDTAQATRAELGLGISRQAFREAYGKIIQMDDVLEKQYAGLISDMKAQSAKLDIPAGDVLDTITKYEATWQKYYVDSALENQAHFAAGGTAEEWSGIQRQRFLELFPNGVEGAARDFYARTADWTRRIAEGAGYKEPNMDELRRLWLSAPEGVVSDPRVESIWQKWQHSANQLDDDLGKLFDNPAVGKEAEADIQVWADGIASELESVGANVDALVKNKDAVAKAASLDMDRAFINYENQNTLDYVLRHVYPFWMYESRAWPRLWRLGLQHPQLLAMFGPGGKYWQYTDNGYLDLNFLPVQINPLRGTIIGRLRRAFQGDFPEYEAGVYGKYLSASDKAEKYGFYPGLHFQALVSLVLGALSEDKMPRVGEFMPPAYEGALNGLMAAGALLEDATNKSFGVDTASRVFARDRFDDRSINMALFAAGVKPSDATPEQRQRAMAKVGTFGLFDSMLSMLRYRPKEYTEFKKVRDETLALIAGISLDKMEDLRKRGIDIRQTRPFDPFEREQYRKRFPMADRLDAYAEVNAALRTKEGQEKAKRVERYYERYDQIKEIQTEFQLKEDLRLDRGLITGRKWQERRKELLTKRRGVNESAKEFAGVTEEDLASVFPNSRMDNALDALFKVSPEESRFTDEETGDTLWDAFFAEQDGVLRQFDSLTREKVKTWLAERGTPNERDFRAGYDKDWGSWFSEDDAVDWYVSRYGHADILANALRIKRDISREVTRVIQTTDLSAEDISGLRRKSSRARKMLEKVQKLYRTELLTRNPGLREWLRKFHDKIA